ncbi:MAG: hypothetical protein ACYDEP_00210 [Acidimicrobiales bacterium]
MAGRFDVTESAVRRWVGGCVGGWVGGWLRPRSTPVRVRPWPYRAGLKTEVFDYIEGSYNTLCLHSSIGNRGDPY